MFEQGRDRHDGSLRRHAEDKLKLANVVRQAKEGDAWELFLSLVRLKEIEITNRDDYATLEDFRADRAGLRFLRGVVAEFEGFADYADDALDMLGRLDAAEGQTPPRTMAGLTARETD